VKRFHDTPEWGLWESVSLFKTSEEYNSLYDSIKLDFNWIDRMISLVKDYYTLSENHTCGGNLHIVLDDENLDDNFISWCAGLCVGCGDDRGGGIANLMECMTMAQRKLLVETYRNCRNG